MIINLEITFTPQTSIDHRVCWKETTDSSYDCSTIATGCVAGVPKTVSINLTVFNESCDDITYEGYVQPICEPEASLLNRTAFPNVTFTPDQPCKYWEAICNPGIGGIGIDDPGSGYTLGSSVPVTITGAGTGATGTCYVSDGSVVSLIINNQGSGYTDGFYENVPVINTPPASGTGLLVNITVFGGIVTSIFPNTGVDSGTGYNPGDQFQVDSSLIGGTGGGAIFEVDETISGSLLYCVINTPGLDYDMTNTATVPGNGLVSVTLGDCSEEYVFGEDCSGQLIAFPEGEKPMLGWPLEMCHPTSLPDPVSSDGWVVEQVEDVCCYECEQTGVQATSFGGAMITYVECGTLETQVTFISCGEGGGCQQIIICHVIGTLNIFGDANIVSGPGPCTPA